MIKAVATEQRPFEKASCRCSYRWVLLNAVAFGVNLGSYLGNILRRPDVRAKNLKQSLRSAQRPTASLMQPLATMRGAQLIHPWILGIFHVGGGAPASTNKLQAKVSA